MKLIPFPYSYKQALISRRKNMTIRIGSEVGKYHEGKIYMAGTYGGKEWGIKIKILMVVRIRENQIEDLKSVGIPKQTVQKVLKTIKKFGYSKIIEIIQFEYC